MMGRAEMQGVWHRDFADGEPNGVDAVCQIGGVELH